MTPPPIASPHVAEEAPSKPPFPGLQVFVALDVVSLLLVPLNALYIPHKSWAATIVVYAIFMALWGWLLWHLWRGSGVARAIFWWTNALSMAYALHKGVNVNLPMWLHVINFLNRAFLAFGLVWLQLPGVKAHFRREARE